MRRIPTQIARRGAALRRQRRQRVSLAANLSPLPADPTKSSYPDSAPIDFDASSAVSGGEAQVLDGPGGVPFGEEGLTEGETEQRVRGIGRDVTSEDFGAAHAQRFALAVERRKMTIERPGSRTSME